MAKTVIMLIGPQGSGKTHIGTILETQMGIRFLHVEPIWLSLGKDQDGWVAVEHAIDNCLHHTDLVTIESLGGSDGF
jgi:ATP-dependent protease Clp ATPase subunit